MNGSIKLGTCSWDFDSWVGLVYSQVRRRPGEYLREYAGKYNTVEIDSWINRLPDAEDIEDYLREIPGDFSFAAKVSGAVGFFCEQIPDSPDTSSARENPEFLSEDVFRHYLQTIRPMEKHIAVLIAEFGHLSAEAVPSLEVFMEKLGSFVSRIDRTIPLAVDIRNSEYLKREYFEFLRERDLIHVFTETGGSPHIYGIYDEFKKLLGRTAVIRLAGEPPKEPEPEKQMPWNRLIQIRPDLSKITDMITDLHCRGHQVLVYVDNHYEGSAPKTIERIESLLEAMVC
ncbi:DUF72 domain-containing protein [Breznakiella homolactica]|uniref:DUF72 domain-containing protein n=1 Tax=Breznakiella homolactica TaxID=2798577 RepID=A0A7T8B971_9SPIR|nr:DUF72 domain-containing protein [Breznakiella homolactica]QQO08046.1 DUF72 domain-containing protein [Breznakiella homolactica]